VGARGGVWCGRPSAGVVEAGECGAPVVSVTLQSEPAGVEVLVDGVARGKTPVEAALPVGQHRLRFVAALGVAESVVEVGEGGGVWCGRPGAGVVEEGACPPPALVTLTLQSDPAGVEVLVDGVAQGKTPVTVAVAPGLRVLQFGEVQTTITAVDKDVWCARMGAQEVARGPCGPRLRIDTVSFGPASFVMGSPRDEVGRFDNEDQHTVRVPRRFALATTEVSQGLYRAVMGVNPSYETNGIGDELPVNQVSWLDAVKFCTKLSVSQGLRPAYTAPGEVDTWEDADAVRWDPEADGWRLPTEAEWELAARAAGKEAYGSTADPAQVCTFANVADDAAKAAGVGYEYFPCNDGFAKLAPVGSLAPQAGLHQMLGNVWEWTWDRYAEDITGEKVDQGGPSGGVPRVYRGGSFHVPPRLVRVAVRDGIEPSIRGDVLGLRLARSLPSAL
jgi:formylglycine-generating enzyme required for sulfatase activity